MLQLLTSINKLKVVGGEARAFGLWADLFGRQRQEQFRSRMLGNWVAIFIAAFSVLCTLVRGEQTYRTGHTIWNRLFSPGGSRDMRNMIVSCPTNSGNASP